MNGQNTPVVDSLEPRLQFAVVVSTLMAEEFATAAINTANWHMPTWSPDGSTFYGRTQIRTTGNAPLPKIVNGAARLTLSRYNPTAPANSPSFWGTELISNQTFDVDTGLDIVVRAKMNTPLQGGIVGGIFLYGPGQGGVNHDEVDTELLSSQLRWVQSNVYANEPLGAGSPQQAYLGRGNEVTRFHTYEMSIYPAQSQVLWFIDGKLVRTETLKVPAGPMSVHLNLWAPAAEWARAYDAGLTPTRLARRNVDWTMDIDSVLVRRVRQRGGAPVTGKPAVTINQVPLHGTTGLSTGTVAGVKFAHYQGVAGYIKAASGWWTRPAWARPLTSINANGTWSMDAWGDDWSELRVYLIPQGMTVPLASGAQTLSPELASLLYASKTR